MSTIVEYTDTIPPQNLFPDRIISPPHSGSCCFTNMETLGTPQADGRWVYQYKRCCRCGFAVRVILKVLPDEDAISTLRATLAGLSGR
jgi:hypothetical protein